MAAIPTPLTPLPDAPGNWKKVHRDVLVVAVVVVVASMLLAVRGGDRVSFAFGSDRVLPQSCLTRSWFGFDCPGCGLTRSFVSLAHGHWRAAWEYHHFGPVLALMVVMQIPYRLAVLNGVRPLPKSVTSVIGYGLIGGLISLWATRVIVGG